MHQAKTSLSTLVERVEAGEEIVIARAAHSSGPVRRLLIALSIAESLTLLTNDTVLEEDRVGVRVF